MKHQKKGNGCACCDAWAKMECEDCDYRRNPRADEFAAAGIVITVVTQAPQVQEDQE